MSDPHGPVRRAMILLAAGMYLFLAILNFTHLSHLLAQPEPRRSVRIGMASVSALSGLLTLYLWKRDRDGRPLPLSACLKPAWLVVGLSLVDARYASGMAIFLFIGLGAALVGLWGIAILLRLFFPRKP